MSIVTRPRAPKRTIQRRRAKVVETTLNNVVTHVTLHTVGDPETLIRLLVKGSAVYDGTGTTPNLTILYSIWRNGNEVVAPLTSGEALDVVEPLEVLARDALNSSNKSDIGIHAGVRVDLDTKIQRKLKSGDLVRASFITNGSTNTWNFNAECTTWYKQN